MTLDKLRELADEVEALQEPSRDMDLRIARALYGDDVVECSTADQRVTESLDAAYSLIPEGWALYSVDAIGSFHATLYIDKNRKTEFSYGASKHHAQAIVAAALRAIAHEKETT